MSNTIIQIKRSTVTNRPVDGSLSASELAYSYASDRLYMGTANGLSVQEIGGRYWIDTTIAAFNKANNIVTDLTPANSWANTIGTAGNNYTVSVGTAGNNYTDSVGAAGNSWATSTFVKLSEATGQTITGDISIAGNLTITGVTTYANTQTLNVGDNIFVLNADLPAGSAPTENAGMEINRGSSPDVQLIWNESQGSWQFTNDGSTFYQIASNTSVSDVAAGANGYAVTVGAAANTWANTVGTAGNNYTVAVGAAGNNYSNTLNTVIFQTFSDAANLTSGTLGSSRLSGSYTGITGVGTITAGTWNGSTIDVGHGGTGITSATLNGVLFGGGGTSALQVTGAGTEGQVLQASAAGVPSFGMLDGGTF